MRQRSGRSEVPIDRTKIIDGLGELVGRSHYLPRELTCGRCAKQFVFTPRDQKYVHEVRGVPIKMATRGRAAYCPSCVPVRAAENRARRRESALVRAYQAALAAMRAAPNDIDAALTIARRAGRLDRERVDSQFWAARAQLAAGAPAGARVSLERFVAEAEGRTGLGRLVGQARALSERLAVPQPTRS